MDAGPTTTTSPAAVSSPLLAHPRTLGEAIHITSDDVLTWNQIAESARGGAWGHAAPLVHVALGTPIAASRPGVGGAGPAGATKAQLDGVRQRQACAASWPGWRAVIPFERGARADRGTGYLADPGPGRFH